jgi:CRP/FNR family transcriptional regulator
MMVDELTLRTQLSAIFERDLVNEILEFGEGMELRDGDLLMDYGKPVRFMPIVIQGTIRVMRKDDQDREIILYYLGNSESCAMAYTCCMEAKKSEVKAIAESDAFILKIPHNKLDEWLMKFPTWKSYIFSSFTNRFNEMLKSLESIAFHKLDERLISYLREKSKIVGKSSLLISHHQIAEEMGTSRVVISRLLKQLENDKKLLLYRNEIKLLSAF